jgi:Ion transport protein
MSGSGNGENAALLEKAIKEVPSIETAQKEADVASFAKRSSSPMSTAAAGSASFRYYLEPLFPDVYDVETVPVGRYSVRRISHPRSMKRRLFLILTEPETSFASASFFALLVVTITMMNLVMILQTMHFCQFTPLDCESCGGNRTYQFDNDDAVISPPAGVLCQCPPAPFEWTTIILQGLVYFFTFEWILRVLSFEPAVNECQDNLCFQWLRFITSPSIVMDALAVFPYYIETFTDSNGLMPLRLLRLFRVLQVVRLGQYNDSFKSLTAVLIKAMPHLKLLVVVLLFGATFFGSMLYWVEKGEWKFFEPTRSFKYVRLDQHGREEISPFSRYVAK